MRTLVFPRREAIWIPIAADDSFTIFISRDRGGLGAGGLVGQFSQTGWNLVGTEEPGSANQFEFS
jgi:hypothetical protein